MMKDAQTLILSAGELYVLSGLMGYPSVFAVEDATLKEWYPMLKVRVQEVMRRLEKRMLVLCEPSGTVYWDEQAARVIRCLCAPQSAALVTGSNESGRRSEAYVLRLDRDIATVRKMTADAYRITLTHRIPDEILPADTPDAGKQPLHVELPFANARRARAALDAFNPDEAESFVQPYAEAHTQTVLNAISGTCRFLRIQCQRRSMGYYSSAWQCLFVFCGDQLIRMQLDGSDRLHIDTVTAGEVIADFSAAMELDC